MSTSTSDRVEAARLEADAVEAGWRLVDAYERLTPRQASEVFAPVLTAGLADARETLPVLQAWPGVETKLKSYADESNTARFRRILDLVRPGDRVLDIGCGPGYLAALLAHDGRIAGYHGVDLNPRLVASLEAMREAYGLDPATYGAQVRDLYELSAAEVGVLGADLVVCCEVLEHVPDPEAALDHLAGLLPPGADFVFSVPLYGRLEAVWGHVTVFDSARLRAMCAAAGLTVHHVEPLANVWALVVASRGPRPGRRVLERRRAELPHAEPLLAGPRNFVPVRPAELLPARGGRGAVSAVAHDTGPAVCTISAGGTGEGVGGVGFGVAGFVAGRLALTGLDAALLRRLEVDLLSGDESLALWTWEPGPTWRKGGTTRRAAFRPGRPGGFFQPVGAHHAGPVDRVEVRGVLDGPGTASFSVSAAYLPS